MHRTGTSRRRQSSPSRTRLPWRPGRPASLCLARPAPGWGSSEQHAGAGRCSGREPRAKSRRTRTYPSTCFTKRRVATPVLDLCLAGPLIRVTHCEKLRCWISVLPSAVKEIYNLLLVRECGFESRRPHQRRSRGGSERVELGVPVEIVAPALVQVVGRKRAAVLLQHVGRRLDRAAARVHPALARQPVALPQIAGGAGGDDVGPDRAPAA